MDQVPHQPAQWQSLNPLARLRALLLALRAEQIEQLWRNHG